MIFTSIPFLIFLLVCVAIFYAVKPNYRWLILLAASYVFYMTIKPIFLLLLIGTTAITYLFTKLISHTTIESDKKRLLILNISLILLPLFYFKYFNSINNAIIIFLRSYNLGWPIPEFQLFLPIGISFYSFMAIGYVIDVYNEEIELEKNIGKLALFISFFPLILSGPIERAKNILPQFNSEIIFSYWKVAQGIKWMIWGYFLKFAVADRIGIYVDAVYQNISMHTGTSLLAASLLYPLQVYADLGGYSLIAIGVASIFGIRVIQNFNRPFFSVSMAAFWRRWHMSFISWLTDYIYTPLNFVLRKYRVRGIVISLIITFLISGIWHGAKMTYVIWGLLQGIFLSIEAIASRKRFDLEKRYYLINNKIYSFICFICTFILFSISQVFAKSATINEALLVFSRIFSIHGSLFLGPHDSLVCMLLGIAIMLMKDICDEYLPSQRLILNHHYKLIRIPAYSILIILILLIGVFDGGQFIYFQY